MITGEEIRAISDPFLVAVKEPIPQYSLAVGRVRYFGEPVALVLASNRYVAEDAAAAVDVDYEPLAAVIDPVEALAPGAPRLHDNLPGNEIRPQKIRLWRSGSGLRRCRSRGEIDHDAIRAIRSRHWNVLSLSRNTVRAMAAMTCFPIFRDHSAPIP